MEQQAQISIQLEKTLPITCEKCGGEVFHDVLFLRKVSKFLTGSPKDSLLPVPSFACVKCGHVNEEFIPAQFRPDRVDQTGE